MNCFTNLIIVISLLRIANIFIDYNYDQPDQYWQGPQIAYKIAQGYGFQTWQWTMQQPIRNGIYQKYLSFAYQFSNLLYLSHYWKEKILKIFQIFISCIGDYFLILLIKKYTKSTSFGTCIIILTNHYYFSMMNRTYINTIETILSIVSFYYWISRFESKFNDYISRFLVILNFVIRPTSIVLWAVIWIYQLIVFSKNKMRFIIKNCLFIIIMLACSIIFNSYWYGKLTFVQFNFFKYNIIYKWSQLYGVNSFFYYFYSTIPLILGPFLIPFIYSFFQYIPHLKSFVFKNTLKKIKKQSQNNQESDKNFMNIIQNHTYCQVFIIFIISLFILSFSTHKQHRFLFVLTPFLLILSIKGIQALKKNNIILLLIILINFGMFFSLNIYGKTGGIQLLRQIREDINLNHKNSLDNIALFYLCEPHSLPLYSILQTNITTRLIDTSPMRKLINFNEETALHQSPYTIFKDLSKDLKQKSIIYLVIQEKYAMKGSILNENYQFLLKDKFKIMSIKNKMNMFQQNQIGYDKFIVLKQQ